jgi:transcription elongation factor GreA
MPKDVILTADGLEKLKLELAHLQGDKRREVALRIKEAREFGDITENSEYDDAKNEQAMLEATVIAAEDVKTDIVQVGSTVSVKDADTGKSQKFTIVGSPEAKPPERLSYESPVGKALLGRKRNDVVDVALPNGRKIQLKITKIEVGV